MRAHTHTHTNTHNLNDTHAYILLLYVRTTTPSPTLTNTNTVPPPPTIHRITTHYLLPRTQNYQLRPVVCTRRQEESSRTGDPPFGVLYTYFPVYCIHTRRL
eukprot:GHVU01067179.1.p1 GENE.GHVU01067179.1~~GHVU01067179.1.p1  ORF type:complete len:102 (+),score=6.75 GHVU01067179.1:186-491(+)